jgi:hypothetical protein
VAAARRMVKGPCAAADPMAFAAVIQLAPQNNVAKEY